MSDETELDLYVHPGKRVTKAGHDNGFGQGMALRDYFAAKAMAAMIGTAVAPTIVGGLSGAESDCAAGAYMMADAMLKERNT